jgi:hypothetical protein
MNEWQRRMGTKSKKKKKLFKADMSMPLLRTSLSEAKRLKKLLRDRTGYSIT